MKWWIQWLILAVILIPLCALGDLWFKELPYSASLIPHWVLQALVLSAAMTLVVRPKKRAS